MLYRETLTRLEVFERRVSENRDVMAASEFCRWLNFSGIFRILDAHPAPEPLKVDGAFLKWKSGEVLKACNDRFRTNDSKPHLAELQLQSLHDKLNTMAGYLSRLVP